MDVVIHQTTLPNYIYYILLLHDNLCSKQVQVLQSKLCLQILAYYRHADTISFHSYS
uniref:Uncharacterized protein n=1 Tax=Meloidogyne incognita TaxID=6306 RepID=A0A914MLQ7_MELIC